MTELIDAFALPFGMDTRGETSHRDSQRNQPTDQPTKIMGMFSNLMGKIFAHAAAATVTPASAAATPAESAGAAPASTPGASVTPAPEAPAPTTLSSTSASAASGATATAPASVDVTAILDGLAAKSSEHLDWRKSIVDMLKLVGMDSSLSARKELATDLAYTGDESDSATMNVWLHQAVIKKLAENGGKVPADLVK